MYAYMYSITLLIIKFKTKINKYDLICFEFLTLFLFNN